MTNVPQGVLEKFAEMAKTFSSLMSSAKSLRHPSEELDQADSSQETSQITVAEPSAETVAPLIQEASPPEVSLTDIPSASPAVPLSAELPYQQPKRETVEPTSVSTTIVPSPLLLIDIDKELSAPSEELNIQQPPSASPLLASLPDPEPEPVIPSLGSEWDFLMDSDLLADEPESSDSSSAPATTAGVLLRNPDAVVDNIQADQLPFILEEIAELVPEIETLLNQLGSGNPKVVPELHRKVHTLKGTVGQVGAMRARTVIHHMETVMEEMENGQHKPADKKLELQTLFGEAKVLIRLLETGEWADHQDPQGTGERPQAVQTPKTVRVNAETVDSMVSEINESRLAGTALEEFVLAFKSKLRDLEENGQRVAKMLRELELQAEMQIQSRKTQLQETGEDFDPLEFDRFTRLQELSRLMGEGVSDIFEVRREIARLTVDQETVLAHQKRSIQATQEKLHKARLTPFDAINDRLHGVVWGAAREVGKEVAFEMSGGRVELDRVLLEKIVGPLEHILRNSVAHGIEEPIERVRSGKNKEGLIHIGVKQEAGRALIEIKDDGFGLRVSKIKEKAVEKGLWKASDIMTDKQAAEMICAPGFSTADAVSQIAGRGVGMDVVRSEVLALGGRFEINSVPRKGLSITIQLPTSIASASVLVVEAGGEVWAFPVEMVEHVALLRKEELLAARESQAFLSSTNDFSDWNRSPFRALDDLTGVRSSVVIQQDSAPVLLLKERDRMMAIEVSRLVQVFEVPLRSAGSIWGGVRGVAGTVILPNGDAVFLVDPFRFIVSLGMSQDEDGASSRQMRAPMVLVVDDSLTVRKATARFLSRNGYEHIMAKDGQEALELLLRIQPSVILMDIEMPRMDGFDCTKNIRDNPKHKDIPIFMITSRTADKHRQHAIDLGVNEYLGKPFKDNELLDLLTAYAPLNSSR